MLSGIMPSIIMLSVIMPSIIMLSVHMPNDKLNARAEFHEY
jgi:hypothetical protein